MPAFLNTNLRTATTKTTTTTTTTTTTRPTTTPKNFLLKRRERLRIRHRARGRRPSLRKAVSASPRPSPRPSPTLQAVSSILQQAPSTEDSPSPSLRLVPAQQSGRQQTRLSLQVFKNIFLNITQFILQDITVFSKSEGSGKGTPDPLENLLAIAGDGKVRHLNLYFTKVIIA